MSENAAHSTHIPFGKYFEYTYLKPCTLNTQIPSENNNDTMSHNSAHVTYISFRSYCEDMHLKPCTLNTLSSGQKWIGHNFSKGSTLNTHFIVKIFWGYLSETLHTQHTELSWNWIRHHVSKCCTHNTHYIGKIFWRYTSNTLHTQHTVLWWKKIDTMT